MDIVTKEISTPNPDYFEKTHVVIIELKDFHNAFAKTIKSECKKYEVDDQTKESLIQQLITHIVQYQTSPQVDHLERHVKMALNIIRDVGIQEPDLIISSWIPLLLATTGKFNMMKLNQSSPYWKMIAYIDGSLHIAPE